MSERQLNKPTSATTGRACPICGKPADPARPPFCSPRCADIDLGRWLKGVYAVPTDEPAEDDQGGARRDSPED